MNGSIEPWARFGGMCQIRRAIAEKIMATGAASCAGFGKVQGVAVDVDNHVTCSVPNGGVGIVIGIIEEPQGCVVGLFGGLRLLGREGDKGNEHGGIHGDGLIKECSNYLLHQVNGLWGKQGGVFVVVIILVLAP